jgi:CTP:molybdopterin cytidylyltransferase MocA
MGKEATELFDELRNAPLDIGARAVVHRYPDNVVEVPTDEAGVVLNIDTPEDYQQYILQRQA